MKSWPSHAINLAIISKGLQMMELLLLKMILPVKYFITIIGMNKDYQLLKLVLSHSHFSKELTLKLKEMERMKSSNGWKITELTFNGTSTKSLSMSKAKSLRTTIALSIQTASEQTSRPS